MRLAITVHILYSIITFSLFQNQTNLIVPDLLDLAISVYIQLSAFQVIFSYSASCSLFGFLFAIYWHPHARQDEMTKNS